MKRDKKLAYEILDLVAKTPTFGPIAFPFHLREDEGAVRFHLDMLNSSNLIILSKDEQCIMGLTWAGFNLLDELRPKFAAEGRKPFGFQDMVQQQQDDPPAEEF